MDFASDGAPGRPRHSEQAKNPDRDVDQTKKADRDPYIEDAIRAERDRQQTWEQGIDLDHDNDRGFEIE